jgi:hypothetical protein
VLECAEQEKLLDKPTIEKVAAFLKDPDGWTPG